MTSPETRSPEPSKPSFGADAANTGREGREHARGFLGRASRYDRYGRSLIPGWAAVLLAAGVLLLTLFVVGHAADLRPPDDLIRALAFVIPLVAVVVLLVVFADRPGPD